ncbi:MAG: type II toxin-antitoxin system prevent-host-death family antitoxin [Candidatus Rokuibacteriota bacterium]
MEMMTTVGIRELKNRLSEFLARVKTGERVFVTDRGRPIAVISPPPDGEGDERITAMVRDGIARWGGGKPRGAARPVRVRGASMARAVIEGRR